ncbi:MAG: AAA family ATPase [Synergistes sp.]|nr:AAA family ATPase [Synergistes sp.]
MARKSKHEYDAAKILLRGKNYFPHRTYDTPCCPKNFEGSHDSAVKSFEILHDSALKSFEILHIMSYNHNVRTAAQDRGGKQYGDGGEVMYFKRKAYDRLSEWKEKYADRYAVLLEGARRVGKSTIAEQFAKNEYKSYLMIDFASASPSIRSCFDDISDLDLFFLRLQAASGTKLIRNESVIIFDEVQLFPKARQAVKYLVKDGRFHYIETGSLISIKKNVKDIVIPSEEMKIQIHPMDYEEFCNAAQIASYEIGREIYRTGRSMGDKVNNKLMRDFRLYMAVGGMPQSVEGFVEGKNFSEIDKIKREIIMLYEEDFKKIDTSGRLSAIFHAIPSALARNVRHYSISSALGRRKNKGDKNCLYDLIDSKTVLPCHNTSDPRVSLSQTKAADCYKLYLSDTGLFVTLLFIDRPETENVIYEKLLSDKLPANLGYLYENAAAQVIASSDRELFYHTWDKKGSTHNYEIDFLLSHGTKISAVEIKSSGTGKHESLTEFAAKYSNIVQDCILLSQKDLKTANGIKFLPVYLAPLLAEMKKDASVTD